MASTGSAPVVVTDEVFWRRDGSCFPVSYSVHPIQEDGVTIGLVCTFVDISERRLLEDQLRHAQKMEAVGQLAGGIAHDFNNILQIISGNTQILQYDQNYQHSEQPQLQEILKAVERGTLLTRSMLAFSRKQTINPVVFELNQMVKDSLLLAQKLLTKDIPLQLELEETALVITADEVLLQQVLFNLITNAEMPCQPAAPLRLQQPSSILMKVPLDLHRDLCREPTLFLWCVTPARAYRNRSARKSLNRFSPRKR